MYSPLTSSSIPVDLSVAGSAGPAGADKVGDTMGWAFVHQLLMGSLKALPLPMPALCFRGKILDGLRGLFQPKGSSDYIQMSGIKTEMNKA